MDTLIFTAELIWGSSIAAASLFIAAAAVSSRLREQIIGPRTDRTRDDL